MFGPTPMNKGIPDVNQMGLSKAKANRILLGEIGLGRTIRILRRERVSSPDVIADVVRSVILSGQLKSGSPIRQDEFASFFDVSRIPVREALRRLCAEGLVDFKDNRGFLVAVLEPEEAREILEIRSTLEIKAARLALSRWNEDTFGALRQMLEEAEATNSLDRWSDLNWSFHDGLYRPAGLSKLIALIANLNAQVERYIRLLVSRSDYRLQAEREHRAILAAAEVRNAPALDALIEQHARETAIQLTQFLSSCNTQTAIVSMGRTEGLLAGGLRAEHT